MTNNDESFISFNSSDVYWNIMVRIKITNSQEKLIVLEWGWTAGMTKEEISELADDCPTGHDSVTTTLEMAKELRDSLDKAIKELEVS